MTFNRFVLSAMVLAFGLGLSGCENLDSMFSTKKPLPGERKEVFPGGVPGVPQGVPPELVKGYQAQPEQAEAPVAELPAEKPRAASRSRAESRPKPRPRPKRVAEPAAAPAPEPQQQAPAPAAPRRAADPAFPPPPAQSVAPSNSPWPDPPKSGTFSR
jgi:hypothetical protein